MSAEQPAPETPPATADNGSTANVVYILYLIAIVVGLTAIAGVVMAYIYRGDAPEWVRTHYRFQIRTFWIGLLISLVGTLLTWIGVGFLILAALLVWWIVRCVKGMKALGERRPIENPATWGW